MMVPRSRIFYICLAIAALLVVLAANAHLVVVATGSQPACVPHAKTGGDTSPPGTFRAARSSC